MGDTETMDDLVRTLAHDTTALIDERVNRSAPGKSSQMVARDALARLGDLLHTELITSERDHELFVRCAHAAMEAWLTGHAALVLGAAGGRLLEGPHSFEHVAHLLDDATYGASERPKAFRRHLRSFYDEIDVAGVRSLALPADRPIDFVRVGLWVTLFLCHDYFAAIGDPATAREARALFDRLRGATDEFYAGRRSAATGTSDAANS
jgi:hypothetical protein